MWCETPALERDSPHDCIHGYPDPITEPLYATTEVHVEVPTLRAAPGAGTFSQRLPLGRGVTPRGDGGAVCGTATGWCSGLGREHRDLPHRGGAAARWLGGKGDTTGCLAPPP
eukprot:gene23395-biopygen16355